MKEEHVFYMVATKVSPEKDKDFNDWYNDHHMPMVLTAPGMVRGKRFKMIGSGEGATYIAMYEMEGESGINQYEASPERTAVQQDGAKARESIGYSVVWRGYYKQILSKEKK